MAAWSGPTSCATRIASFANTLNEDASVSRTDASQFCAPPSPEQLLAVLGIFSIETAGQARLEARESWMVAGQVSGILPRFVLFGLGIPKRILVEAAAHEDIVFLRERSARGIVRHHAA